MNSMNFNEIVIMFWIFKLLINADQKTETISFASVAASASAFWIAATSFVLNGAARTRAREHASSDRMHL